MQSSLNRMFRALVVIGLAGGTASTNSGRTATINLDPGETATCTMTPAVGT